MDGWESRRKRVPGHDWCIVRLGAPAIVYGFVVDTSFFRGNFPSHASIEGVLARLDAHPESLEGWTEIVPKSELKGDSKNAIGCKPVLVSHLRLNIFPDGGVARLRVHGEAIPDFRKVPYELDVAAIENGGRSLSCSDMFFGVRHNILMPGRAPNMSDGWETRRRRSPGFDWNLVALAGRSKIRAIEIDTNHFKGNFPDTCSIETCDADAREIEHGSAQWREILPRTKLQAHTRHFFVEELDASEPATHVRLCVHPDGGVSRMRVFGSLTEDAHLDLGLTRINAMPLPSAEKALLACCGSAKWAKALAAKRPFPDEESLVSVGDEVWTSLSREDYLEAFAAHPAIGAKTSKGWSSEEQKGTRGASEETMRALAEENARYREKFGFVFLVCATGKTADEMLELLRKRFANDPQTEVGVAAEEQRKITHLRVRKLLLG
jgi:allantoicase